MKYLIQNSVSQWCISDNLKPLTLRGLWSNQGIWIMPVINAFEQIVSLLSVQYRQFRVIQNHQIHFSELLSQFELGSIRPGDSKLRKKPWESQVFDTIFPQLWWDSSSKLKKCVQNWANRLSFRGIKANKVLIDNINGAREVFLYDNWYTTKKKTRLSTSQHLSKAKQWLTFLY